MLTAAALASACDPGEPPSDDELARRATRAVDHGSDSLDDTPRLAYIGALFATPPGLDPTDPDAVRRDAVAAVHQRLSSTFTALGCEAALDTDGETRVSLAVEGCRLLLWTFDIELEATARIQGEACDAGTCATAVVWDVDIAELRSRRGVLPPSGLSGPGELHAPLDATQPMQWHTYPGFVLETRRGLRFETLVSASWHLDDDDCVTLDLGARLALESSPPSRPDGSEADQSTTELDEALGDVVVSARGMRRCPGQCPEAGHVELSFGTGQVLAWTHDGAGTITVTGPRGRQLEARLPCAEEPAAGAEGE